MHAMNVNALVRPCRACGCSSSHTTSAINRQQKLQDKLDELQEQNNELEQTLARFLLTYYPPPDTQAKKRAKSALLSNAGSSSTRGSNIMSLQDLLQVLFVRDTRTRTHT